MALESQLEAVEVIAKRYPKLQWGPEDSNNSVLVHSTVNALRNQIAVIEHNSAGKRLRRPLQRWLRGRQGKSAARVSFVEGCSTIPRSAECLEEPSSASCIDHLCLRRTPERSAIRGSDDAEASTQMMVPSRSCSDKESHSVSQSHRNAGCAKLCALTHVGSGAAMIDFDHPILYVGLE